MHTNTTGDERAKLAAANAVTRMNGRMRHKLSTEDQERLAAAIVRSDAQDDLLFRPSPVRYTPPFWALSGMLSRIALIWTRRRKGRAEDERAALSEMHYKVRQSGAVALVIALLVSVGCGVIEFGAPAELALQAARDKTRPVAASGNIVVIAQDEKSRQMFGRWPWARRNDAALVNALNKMGVKNIVFSDVFSEPTDTYNDALFADALRRSNGNVWLGAQFEMDSKTKSQRPILPIVLFRLNSKQAMTHVWVDAFGYTKYAPSLYKIGNKNYRSSAFVLAGESFAVNSVKPDTAIDYLTIPTISMADVIIDNVNASQLKGKTVIVGATSGVAADFQKILGQSPDRIPAVYTRVIAAETIKNGIARELGWLPPLLAAAAIALACVTQTQRRSRAWLLAVGSVSLLVVVLIGDQIGLHFELVPALLLLSIFAVREGVKRKVLVATTTHPVSGLPNLTELHYIRNRETCTILALKVEQYPAVIGNLPAVRQREMIHAVAARIGIVCPNSIVHQGDDGLFVWLIPHESEDDIDTLPGQLLALFMVDVSDSYAVRMIGVSVGRCADLSFNFGERLAVASDRAKASAYITLREVL